VRPNVKQFVELVVQEADLPSPIIDIGSLRTEGQEDTADLRPAFGGRSYTGIDMRRGPGVDCLGTIHDLPLTTRGAGTVLVIDALEHVLDPLAAMHEVIRTLRPGGVLMISSVMNFAIHAYPSDYWRFTPMVFDYMLRALPQRYVFTQGDAENPHTIVGIAIMASPEDDAAVRFRAAIRRVQDRWPEYSFGGPLDVYQSIRLDTSQRVADRDLPLISAGHRVRQTFVCNQPRLSRIDVLMSNRKGAGFRHTVFRVVDETSNSEIAIYRVLGWHILDNAWRSIPVPEQAESKGRRYTVVIESPDADEAQAVTAKASASTTYSDGQLYWGDEPIEGSLAFQTYCTESTGTVTDPSLLDDPRSQRIANDPGIREADRDMVSRLRVDEQAWERTRYIAAAHSADIDALREQVRADHAELRAEHAELLALLRDTAAQSADALRQASDTAEFVRNLRNSRLYRASRRIFGGS
jgi:hypothetical protein